MAKFIPTRELKNQITTVLHEVERGITVIVTRHGNPIAMLKPFDAADIQPSRSSYPTTLYDSIRVQIETRYPAIKARSPEQQKRDFERITKKLRQTIPYKSWQEMDKTAKGDRYGLMCCL